TASTWVVAVTGFVLIGLLGSLQVVAIIHPRTEWTIKNIYGGDPSATDPKAYFAYNQGYAWADPFFWAPLQIAGSIGMLAGQRWGFLLAVAASVPYWYTAITIFIWDRDLGFRKNTLSYWVIIWGMFPVFGMLQGVYSFIRLL
ncbi:MAG: hypothetical protein OEY62_03900, partial [Acidimicrobiia bacterium]|nr:hypothetical protein [Acidimicrobiia bacterium]